MTGHLLAADGHGPEWAAGVAGFADRAGAAFGRAGAGCVTLVDLQPWRVLDAWWLRRRLEPLARLSGRPLRYVPCTGPSTPPRAHRGTACAPAWSVGAAPVELAWPPGSEEPQCKASGRAWAPEGLVIVLAGDLAQQLPQDLLLAHHGQIHEWGGEADARQWQAVEPSWREGWIGDSIRAYATGLPSSMLSLPIGYWHFLEHAMAWASHGCLVLARAEGWSSLAEIREDAASQARVSAEASPVNFHWLAQQLPRIGAIGHTVRACRDDAVQLVAGGLPGAECVLPTLCAPLSAATGPARGDRARAVRLLATHGDLAAAMSVLQLSEDDPALLRAAWDLIAPAAASASPALSRQVGDWIERVMAGNPWIADDPELLRAAGHIALASARLDLARTALRTLEEQRRAVTADLVALARCLEQLGDFDGALAACDRALARHAGQKDALAARERIAARLAAMQAPWRVRHAAEGSALVLDPLHPDHAPMLLRQMRDPSIASMTALPALEAGDDGRGWIRTRVQDSPATYAVLHRQLGFVGYLDLRIWQTTAFICYWIGPDFQGLGLCAPAIELACALAWRNGMALLLSSAYDDNVRSLRALHKRGFRTMDVRAIAPDCDRTFVMLPAAPMDADEARRRLLDFCDNTGSGLRFDATAQEPPAEAASTSCTSSMPSASTSAPGRDRDLQENP